MTPEKAAYSNMERAMQTFLFAKNWLTITVYQGDPYDIHSISKEWQPGL